jgi:hypothetical protein
MARIRTESAIPVQQQGCLSRWRPGVRLKSTWSTRRAPSCSSMPAISSCLEEGGLALSIRTLAGLAQVQESEAPAVKREAEEDWRR